MNLDFLPATAKYARFSLLVLIALVASLITIEAPKADAYMPNRVEIGELQRMQSGLSISSTVITANSYWIVSPVKGWLKRFECVNEGIANLNGPVTITPKVGGVSITALAVTLPSGTVPGGTSATDPYPNANLPITTSSSVAKYQGVELKPVPTATNGNNVKCTLTIIPNYK